MLEVRKLDQRLHAARKARKPDEWDPPIEPLNRMDQGNASWLRPGMSQSLNKRRLARLEADILLFDRRMAQIVASNANGRGRKT